MSNEATREFWPGWADAGGKQLAEQERQGTEITETGWTIKRGRWKTNGEQKRASVQRGAASGGAARAAMFKGRREQPNDVEGDD